MENPIQSASVEDHVKKEDSSDREEDGGKGRNGFCFLTSPSSLFEWAGEDRKAYGSV